MKSSPLCKSVEGDLLLPEMSDIPSVYSTLSEIGTRD